MPGQWSRAGWSRTDKALHCQFDRSKGGWIGWAKHGIARVKEAGEDIAEWAKHCMQGWTGAKRMEQDGQIIASPGWTERSRTEKALHCQD
mmetsp:Transcript_7383/g.17842  ORF Transcript_7383/g.17842 Transcript_7383/m.17842 type:complete len:90 (+) Transcript_7383:100-369(+)